MMLCPQWHFLETCCSVHVEWPSNCGVWQTTISFRYGGQCEMFVFLHNCGLNTSDIHLWCVLLSACMHVDLCALCFYILHTCQMHACTVSHAAVCYLTKGQPEPPVLYFSAAAQFGRITPLTALHLFWGVHSLIWSLLHALLIDVC